MWKKKKKLAVNEHFVGVNVRRRRRSFLHLNTADCDSKMHCSAFVQLARYSFRYCVVSCHYTSSITDLFLNWFTFCAIFCASTCECASLCVCVYSRAFFASNFFVVVQFISCSFHYTLRTKVKPWKGSRCCRVHVSLYCFVGLRENARKSLFPGNFLIAATVTSKCLPHSFRGIFRFLFHFDRTCANDM